MNQQVLNFLEWAIGHGYAFGRLSISPSTGELTGFEELHGDGLKDLVNEYTRNRPADDPQLHTLWLDNGLCLQEAHRKTEDI